MNFDTVAAKATYDSSSDASAVVAETTEEVIVQGEHEGDRVNMTAKHKQTSMEAGFRQLVAM